MTSVLNHLLQLSGNKIILVLTFWLVSLTSFGQETFDIEEKEGVKYYVYFVQQGNTLYGIKTLFKIDESEIFKANPGMTTNLEIGQKILIPVSKSDYKQEVTGKETSKKYKIHVVQKGETLYGLSRKYKISIDEIKKANPEMTELTKGYELNIPTNEGEAVQNDPVVEEIPVVNEEENPELVQTEEKTQYEWNDSIVEHKVLKHETLYSISKRYMVPVDTLKAVNKLKSNALSKGQVIIIPLKSIKQRDVLEKEVPKEELANNNKRKSEFKDVYNITLMLPLFLDKNAYHLAKATLSQPKDILPKTKIALEFYMGFMLAVDSLKQAGVNLNIQVLDTKGDSLTAAKFLIEKNIKDSDLIIGPLYNDAIEPVAQFAQKEKIHMVIPFSAGNKYLFNNQYVSKFVTSNLNLLKGTVAYIANRYPGKNVVLIKSTYKKDKQIYEKAIEFLNEKNIPFVEKDLSTNDMGSYFNIGELNLVLAPSTNRIFASNIFVGLNKTLNIYGYKDTTEIHLFGVDDWDRYPGIKMKYKTRMNFHYAAPVYVDWNNDNVKHVLYNYRHKYFTDPTKYGLHGFDVAMFYLTGLELFGTGFSESFQNIGVNPIANKVQMNQVGDSHGFENSSFFMIRYTKDFMKILTD